MKGNSLNKLSQEDETEQLRELFFSEVDALMTRYAFMTRRSPIGPDVERLTMSLQVEWIAAAAEQYGMERGEFLTAAANAFDLAVESADADDDGDGDEPASPQPTPASPPSLALVPDRKEDP